MPKRPLREPLNARTGAIGCHPSGSPSTALQGSMASTKDALPITIGVNGVLRVVQCPACRRTWEAPASLPEDQKGTLPGPSAGKGWHYAHCARCFQPTFFITDALKPEYHYPQNNSKLRRNLISYWYPDFTHYEEERRKLLCELRPGVHTRVLFAWRPVSQHWAACWSRFSQVLAPLYRCQLFAALLSDMFVF